MDSHGKCKKVYVHLAIQKKLCPFSSLKSAMSSCSYPKSVLLSMSSYLESKYFVRNQMTYSWNTVSKYFGFEFIFSPILLLYYPFRADFLPLPASFPTNPPLAYHTTHKGQRGRHKRNAPSYRDDLVATSHQVYPSQRIVLATLHPSEGYNQLLEESSSQGWDRGS